MSHDRRPLIVIRLAPLQDARQINNAQMASVPGHGLWPLFVRAMLQKAAEGNTYPLEATGPALLTRTFLVGGPGGASGGTDGWRA